MPEHSVEAIFEALKKCAAELFVPELTEAQSKLPEAKNARRKAVALSRKKYPAAFFKLFRHEDFIKSKKIHQALAKYQTIREGSRAAILESMAADFFLEKHNIVEDQYLIKISYWSWVQLREYFISFLNSRFLDECNRNKKSQNLDCLDDLDLQTQLPDENNELSDLRLSEYDLRRKFGIVLSNGVWAPVYHLNEKIAAAATHFFSNEKLHKDKNRFSIDGIIILQIWSFLGGKGYCAIAERLQQGRAQRVWEYFNDVLGLGKNFASKTDHGSVVVALLRENHWYPLHTDDELHTIAKRLIRKFLIGVILDRSLDITKANTQLLQDIKTAQAIP